MFIIYWLSRLRLLLCFLAGFRPLFFIFSLPIFLFSTPVFSQDYVWFDSYGHEGQTSGTGACNTALSTLNQPGSTAVYTLKSITVINSTTADCIIFSKNIGSGTGEGESTFTHRITRQGTTCPSGVVYNPVTLACETTPPPVCKVGDPFPAKGSVGPVVTTAEGRSYPVSSPPTACYNQCTYSPPPDVRPVSCYGTPGGEGWCNYIIKSTGANCSADSYTFATSGPQLNPADTPNVPPSDPDPYCGPNHTNFNGTCAPNPPKPCDPSTGAVCAPGTTDPNKPNPEPGAGGSPGTTPEGTADHPDTSSGADSDLEKLEESKPKPDACKPKADGSGCGGPTVRGEQCDKVVECTGDAILCASLRQQKKMACAYEYAEARPFIEQQVAKDAYKLTTKSVDGSSLFSDGTGAARWLPTGCPAPKPINIKGVSTSLSFQPACDFASGLSYVLVALASVFFAIYVGRAFGGS